MTVNTPIIAEISEQYRATLKMIGDVIVNCKDDLWQNNSQDVIISQLVNHVLFSAGLWLSKTDDERKAFNEKYPNPGPPFNNPEVKLTKEQLTGYLNEVKEMADKLFATLTVEELTSCQLSDLGGSKSLMNSLLFGIRHSTHHIGALHARLTALGNDPIPWVNQVYGDERDTWEEMNNRGVIFIQQGKFAEAEKIYAELCAKSSNNPNYFYNLACVYSREGISEKALETLKSCLILDTNNGFKDLAKRDSDFTNIRELPAFKQLIFT